MTAQYKLRTKTTENDRGMVHVTIQIEKHLFLDAPTFEKLRNVADGIQGLDELLDGSGGIAQILAALGPEKAPTGLLGLETQWKSISEYSAETLLAKFYSKNPSFAVTLQGDVRNASVLIAAGRASTVISLSPDQAAKDKAKLEELARYCEAHPPTKESEVRQAIDEIVGVAGQTTSIMGVGEVCLMGGMLGGMLAGALVCIGTIAAALGGFLGWVGAHQQKQQQEKEMRDRERVCGGGAQAGGGPAYDRMADRISRTC